MPPLRPCLEPDCTELGTGSRCLTHAKGKARVKQRREDARRGTTAQRGYGAAHQRAAKEAMRGAIGRGCPRCREPMLEGQPLDMGHTDDRLGYEGPTHAVCNRGKRRVN